MALHYASRYPKNVDKLVLCSAPVLADFKVPRFFSLLRTRWLGEVLAPVASPLLWKIGMQASIRRRDPTIDQLVQSFARPFTGRGGSRRLLQLLRWGDPATVMGEAQRLLSTIDVPTLVLHGTGDRAIPVDFARRAAALVPDGRARTLPGGHFLPLEEPDRFTDEVHSFLHG